MTPEQTKRIIKRFIEEISSPKPCIIPDQLVVNLPKYKELSDALNALQESHDHLLDFAQVETNPRKWKILTQVLKSGVTITVGTPSQMTHCDLNAMRLEATSINDDLFIDTLPQPDYFNRVTQIDKMTLAEMDDDDRLIVEARDKLASLLTAITGDGFDKTRNQDIEKLITDLKKIISEAEGKKDLVTVASVKKQLIVAEDLLKVNNLRTIVIPGERGYCTLAESAGGVTEKVSLVSHKKVKEQLGHLRVANPADVNAYIAGREQYKLSTEAILKLPKHGKIKEVQHESIALNISRILDLETTRSSMVSHQGKPALFVPFEKIRLLNDFAQGETLNVLGNTLGITKTYQHYSTVNPVGEGLQSDSFIEDFGNALGLLYVSSDPDSIGGYNQNKALKDSRSLFIFDQVVMSADKFRLDSRMSLIPDSPLKFTRHDQGRNRTLIEDSSVSSKFDGIINVLQKQKRIYKSINRTIEVYTKEMEQIDKELNNPASAVLKGALKEKKAQLEDLKNDAQDLLNAIKRRIDKIITTLPKVSNHVSRNQVRQALVLEKLVHNPRLFTILGRPYKNPWTSRHNNPISHIFTTGPNEKLLITFEKEIPIEMLRFLKARGGLDSLRIKPPNELEISAEDLNKLEETMLHPETCIKIDHKEKYLDKAQLKQISQAYGLGHRTRILNLITEYQGIMADIKVPTAKKLDVMNNTRICMQILIDKSKDKDMGFGMNVMKKLHFDIQQHLQMLMPKDHKPANIDAAFSAALKLDRVALFNKVVSSAIENNKLNSPEFHHFLKTCIDQSALARNHQDACTASQEIERAGFVFCLRRLEIEPTTLHEIRIMEELAIDDLDAIDPSERREAELQRQRENIANLVPPAAAADERKENYMAQRPAADGVKIRP